jgi:hypothetical protein
VLQGLGLLEGTPEPEQELPEELRNLTAMQLLRDRQLQLQAEGIAVPTALLKG